MTAAQFTRLVDNVRADGDLTSAVLGYQPPGQNHVEILSGHHRTLASIEVGLPEIDVLVITSFLTEERKRAIQLSHNAITGQDDISILKDLYEGLDLQAKKFSGLTDDVFKGLENINVGGLSVGSVKYQDLSFAFLPDDLQEAVNALEVLRKAKGPKVDIHVAHLADFDRFFDAILETKRVTGVYNGATAVAMVARLALERLAQIEAEQATEEAEAQADAPPADKAKPKAAA